MASDQQYRLWTPLEKVSPEFVDGLSSSTKTSTSTNT